MPSLSQEGLTEKNMFDIIKANKIEIVPSNEVNERAMSLGAKEVRSKSKKNEVPAFVMSRCNFSYFTLFCFLRESVMPHDFYKF